MASGAPVLQVKDTKGRALEIELISADAKTVTFRRKGDPKEFRLGLDQFDGDSQTLITRESAALPAPFPKVEAEVVVGKRRDKGDSYYLVTQTISCEVKIKNPSHDLKVPPVTAKVLFIGQNQKSPDSFTVLSLQTFPVELAPGATADQQLKPFVTNYDSDNKGTGNIGGYQYSGHLLMFIDANQEVVFSTTTDGSIRAALAADPALLKAISTYKDGDYLNGKMVLQDKSLKPPEVRR